MLPGIKASQSLARAQARLIAPGMVEIKCVGNLSADDTAYLSSLSRLIDAESGPVSLLFEAMELHSYSPKFPLAHIDFFRDYHARLHRIAVAHELKSIAFAIATVSLASNTLIKGFPNVADAMAWLREV
ncbi:MAG: STAS/SEC14 domain-containing protein [Myxococcales bacterium]